MPTLHPYNFTHCDEKSFAWQQKFCAFNKFVRSDKFGKDVKLSNGNIASRILPIRIHDLDSEDQATLAKESGGPLRAIDFIYRSSGINRPLNIHEEQAHDNLNKTYYRDQINKVSNAIREIIQALKKSDLHSAGVGSS